MSQSSRHRFTPEEARAAAKLGAALERMRRRELLARHTHALPCPYCNHTLPRPASRDLGATCRHCGTVIPANAVVPALAHGGNHRRLVEVH